MADDDVQTVRRIYAALQRGDVDELRTALTHDIEWNLPEALPWGGTHHGHDGVDAVTEVFGDHVEGSWADPDDYLDAGDRVVVLGRARGRARSSGQTFEVAFAHVWALTDGMPSWFRGYFDTRPIVAALEGRPDPE